MISKNCRVRFAPSPTGTLQLGNIRAALMNYLFAKKMGGVFVLRIEDTDLTRNIANSMKQIIDDLGWLGLNYDEGPLIEGPYGPYEQSKRTNVYQARLTELKEQGMVYKCYCTQERLESLRALQIATKQPPRYDRHCLKLSSDDQKKLIDTQTPSFWRFKLDETQTIVVTDLARGKLTFNLKHFSDFAITRTDQTFTFLFTNTIDDIAMEMSHIIRGEDHLSNSALQIALFSAFKAPVPILWSLPMILDDQGKKLSKRTRGFSLKNLIDDGYLKEAICNYLCIMGKSFNPEIISLDEAAHLYDFDNLSHHGSIQYDAKKLLWINHEWIKRLPPATLIERAHNFLKNHAELQVVPNFEELSQIIKAVQKELRTLQELVPIIHAYQFLPKEEHFTSCTDLYGGEFILEFANKVSSISSSKDLSIVISDIATEKLINKKELYGLIRLLSTGTKEGIELKTLIDVLGLPVFFEKIKRSARVWNQYSGKID